MKEVIPFLNVCHLFGISDVDEIKKEFEVKKILGSGFYNILFYSLHIFLNTLFRYCQFWLRCWLFEKKMQNLISFRP